MQRLRGGLAGGAKLFGGEALHASRDILTDPNKADIAVKNYVAAMQRSLCQRWQ